MFCCTAQQLLYPLLQSNKLDSQCRISAVTSPVLISMPVKVWASDGRGSGDTISMGSSAGAVQLLPAANATLPRAWNLHAQQQTIAADRSLLCHGDVDAAEPGVWIGLLITKNLQLVLRVTLSSGSCITHLYRCNVRASTDSTVHGL
jgi:hypothetical protein